MADDFKLQVNYKIGNDLINIRAGSAEELSTHLEGISMVAGQIIATRNMLQNAQVIAPLSTPASTPQAAVMNSQMEEPAWATTPPPGTYAVPAAPVYTAPPTVVQATPTCQHGNRIHRQGTSKTSGKAYDFWACPTPQGTPDQCKPVN